MSTDINYKYKIKYRNEKIERKETIIVFGNQDRLKILSDEKFVEYFIDFTYKIIPKNFKPYKMMSIATIDYDNNTTILVGFVNLKYIDSQSILNVFKYLNENFNFNPKIIHSDFDNAIATAVKNSNFFKIKIIHVKCFSILLKI